MLDGLALLPIADVTEGMAYVKQQLHADDVEQLPELPQYFDATYVSGSLRPVRNRDATRLLLQLTRAPPTFPPVTWNQHRATVDGRNEPTTSAKAGITLSAA